MFANPLSFRMHSIVRSHIALLVVNVIYGINYSMAKLVMPHYIQPFGFVVLRAACALVLFSVCLIFFMKEKIQTRDIPRLMLLGVFGVAINQMLFLKGLDLTTPINAAIIMTSNPVLVLILSAIALKEGLSIKRITGVIFGIAGSILIIASGKAITIGLPTFTGDLCIFINSLSWAVFIVLVKPLMARYNAMTVITWVFFFGTIYVIPFGYDEFLNIRWAEMDSAIWLAVVFVVVFSTFITYLLNTFALRALSATVVSYYIYLQPILAAGVAMMMGQDNLTAIKCFAALLTFAGIYLVSRNGGRVKE